MYTIYGKEKCPFCFRAKELLKNEEVTYIDIKELNPGEIETLKQTYNVTTVPVIFKGVRFIGGYDDLVREYNNDNTIQK